MAARRIATTEEERAFLQGIRQHMTARVVQEALASGISVEVEEPEQGDTALILACRRGDVGVIDVLLNAGADVNHRNKKGSSPLIAAAMKGYTALCAKLLDRGADPNAETESRDTALSLATWQNQTDVCILLMSRGADIVHVDSYGDTLLLDASKHGNHRLMRELLERKIDVNHQNKAGDAAIHRAAEKGDADGVALLLRHRANPALQNKQGRTPLMLALQGEKMDVVSLLLQHGAPLNTVDGTGATPLMMMVDLAGRPGRAQRGYWNTVATMVRKGASLAQPPKLGETLLSRAASEAQEQLVITLLEKGVSPNSLDMGGRSPLLSAVMGSRGRNTEDSVKMVRLLLDRGADANLQDEKGNTPLMAAAVVNSPDICRLLIDRGATVLLANKSGETALDIALKANSTACIPVLSGGGPLLFLHYAQTGNLPELKRALEQPGGGQGPGQDGKEALDVNLADANGRTALMLAARHGSLACVQYLLAMKARPEAEDREGANALLYAIRNRSVAAAELLLKIHEERRAGSVAAEEFKAATRFLVRLGTQMHDALDQQKQIQQLQARVAELEGKRP